MQVVPVAQGRLHPPQLAESVVMSMQVDPQQAPVSNSSAAGRWHGSPWRASVQLSKPHRPPAHVSAPLQLLGSVWESAHVPPQHSLVAPAPHAVWFAWPTHEAASHNPPMQERPAEHRLLQVPQLEGSVSTFVQPPPAQQSSDVPDPQ